MSVIEYLRPIEALYLLDHAGKEHMTYENSLAAILFYLANEDYIKPKDEIFVITDKANKNKNNLRLYERDCIDAISTEDEKDLLNTIKNSTSKK